MQNDSGIGALANSLRSDLDKFRSSITRSNSEVVRELKEGRKENNKTSSPINKSIKALTTGFTKFGTELSKLGKEQKVSNALLKEQPKQQEKLLKNIFAPISKQIEKMSTNFSKSMQRDRQQKRKEDIDAARDRSRNYLSSIKDFTSKALEPIKNVLSKLNLGDLVKGLALFTMIKNPELFAQAIKSIAEGAVALAETINSKEFKDGMAVLAEGLVLIARIGIGALNKFLDGIAGVSKGIKDIMDGKFFEIDWKDLSGDIGNVAIGLGGLALIVAPGATLAVGLKVITGSVKLLAGSIGAVATGMSALAGIFASPAFLAGAALLGAELVAPASTADGTLDSVRDREGRLPGDPGYDRNTAGQSDAIPIVPPGIQTGSYVPGSGNGDKVPALLEPGEYVLNKKLVSAMGVNNLNAMNFGMVPRFQEGGQVVEYITGDRSHSNYRADHGGANYHEHLAFASREQRDAAIRALQNAGFTIGSTDRNQPGSYHHVGQALDVPFNAANQSLGYTDDRAGEERFSADVRRALSAAGYGGSGITTSATALPSTTPDTYTVSGVTYDMATGASINPETGQPRSQPFSVPTGSTVSPTTPQLPSLLAGLGPFAKMFDVLKGIVDISSITSLLTGNSAAAAASPARQPLSGTASASAKQMYNYIKSKGYTSAQAKGIVANIQRESSFRLDAVGDNGNSFGLFQWNRPAGRSGPMMAAVPDWRTNWQAQIDYALREDVGPQYRSATQGMTAHQAADWWMRNWERSAHHGRDSARHAQFLPTYQFKTGGLIPSRNPNAQGGGQSMKTTPSTYGQEYQQLSRSGRSMGLFDLHGNSRPVVVPVPMPSGGGGTGSSGSAGAGSQVPTLSATPSSVVASDYLMRLNMGLLLV